MAARRNLTPPEVAELYNVGMKKVLLWIRTGELKAMNFAHRTSRKPRYSIKPEALEAFERSRQVVPDGGESTTQRLRRRAAGEVREFV